MEANCYVSMDNKNPAKVDKIEFRYKLAPGRM
jgi:hypothetical protein